MAGSEVEISYGEGAGKEGLGRYDRLIDSRTMGLRARGIKPRWSTFYIKTAINCQGR